MQGVKEEKTKENLNIINDFKKENGEFKDHNQDYISILSVLVLLIIIGIFIVMYFRRKLQKHKNSKIVTVSKMEEM